MIMLVRLIRPPPLPAGYQEMAVFQAGGRGKKASPPGRVKPWGAPLGERQPSGP